MGVLVVKVGGAVAEESAAEVLALAEGNDVCVVHGAGPQISAEMERAGIPVEFKGGRRVTSPEGLEVVRASLAAVNEALCAALGERAVPLAGDEIGLEATPVEGLGLVGEVVPRELPALAATLGDGRIPVVAPIAARQGGEGLLNVNADDAAAAIAVGLPADRLVFLTDVEGFLLDGEVVDELGATEAEELIAGGTLDPRILPKLGAAVTAARGGVAASIGRTRIPAEVTA